MALRSLTRLAAAALLSIAALAPVAASADLVMLSNGGRTGVAEWKSPGAALTLASQQRAAHGLRAVHEDRRLQHVAQEHANWMARNGQMSHVGANGTRMADRLRRVGYRACVAAENVAFGQRDDRSVVSAWMNSSSHRRAILNNRVTTGTVASATDGVGQTYWVMLLAQPC